MHRKKPSSSNKKKAVRQEARAIKRGESTTTSELINPDGTPKIKPSKSGVKSHLSRSLQTGTVDPSAKQQAKALESKFHGTAARASVLSPEEVNQKKLLAFEESLERPIPPKAAVWEELSVPRPGDSQLSLRCPKRPKWKYGQTKKEVEKNEEGVFGSWLKEMDEIQEQRREGFRERIREEEEVKRKAVQAESEQRLASLRPRESLQSTTSDFSIPTPPCRINDVLEQTPLKATTLPSPSVFERNLQVWRQLWRVTEQSQILLLLLDVRCPALHFPPSLRIWLRELMGLPVEYTGGGSSTSQKIPVNGNSRKGQDKPLKEGFIPAKRVVIVLTKVDLVESEVVEGWKKWCKDFWRYGQLLSDERFMNVEELTKEEHEAEDIDVVGVSSYKEKELKEDTQNLRHRQRIPHIPPTYLTSLFEALQRAHAKLLVMPKKIKDEVDLVKKDRWQADLEARVKREIDWEGLKSGEANVEESLQGSEEAIEAIKEGDSSPSPTGDAVDHGLEPAKFLSIGLIGQPNIGKSSLLNALLGESRVRASKTPGKTKHFQTIFWSEEVRVVDCPGLVMPSFVPMELQAMAAILPISQISSIPSCIHVASKVLPLERILGLPLPLRWVEENARKQEMEEKKTRRTIQTDLVQNGKSDEVEWSAGDIMQGWAEERGFLTAKAGRPDTNRAGNAILRAIAEGKIPWRFLPPGQPELLAIVESGSGVWVPDVTNSADLAISDGDEDMSEAENSIDGKEEGGQRKASTEESADEEETEGTAAPASRFALLAVEENDEEEEEGEEEEGEAGVDEKDI